MNRGLNRELDYGAYEVEIHSAYVRQFSPIRSAVGEASSRRYPNAKEDLSTDYFWIFPNWMLNCYPDNISLNVTLPLGPDRASVIFEWYLPKDSRGSENARRAVAFSDEIQNEDAAICETVQRNLASRSYDRGRYSVRQEKGVHAFHCMYGAAMAKE